VFGAVQDSRPDGEASAGSSPKQPRGGKADGYIQYEIGKCTFQGSSPLKTPSDTVEITPNRPQQDIIKETNHATEAINRQKRQSRAKAYARLNRTATKIPENCEERPFFISQHLQKGIHWQEFGSRDKGHVLVLHQLATAGSEKMQH